MNKNELQKLREKYDNKEIACLLNKSLSWVEKKVKEYGLPRKSDYAAPLEHYPTSEELRKYLIRHKIEDAANHFNICTQTVQRLMKKYNLEHIEEIRMDVVTKDELENLSKNYTTKKISEILNISVKRVNKLYKRFEIIKKYVKNSTINENELRHHYSITENQTETARILGVSPQAVQKALNKFNIPYKKKVRKKSNT